ncbi:unnamed protein product [Urochloa humidicola]
MAPSTSLGKISLPRQQRHLLQPIHSPKHKRVTATPPVGFLQELFGDGPKPRRASDETLAVHAGEKLGKGADEAASDSIATPIVSGTTHWFKSSEDLIAFKEGRRHSHEYGRYSNPTVKVLEDKISALERAEATLVTSSGMNAIVATLLALVPPGGHVVTTTDCYSEARAFIRDRLSKMGIRSTFIDLDDMEMLKSVLDQEDVTLLRRVPNQPTAQVRGHQDGCRVVPPEGCPGVHRQHARVAHQPEATHPRCRHRPSLCYQVHGRPPRCYCWMHQRVGGTHLQNTCMASRPWRCYQSERGLHDHTRA